MSFILKKTDITCLLISLAPMLLLFASYGWLAAHPYTHVYGSGGLSLSRSGFTVMMAIAGLIFYLTALMIADRLPFLASTNKNKLRVLFNVLFSLLSCLLILSNLGITRP